MFDYLIKQTDFYKSSLFIKIYAKKIFLTVLILLITAFEKIFCSGEIVYCIGWVIYRFKFGPSIISNLAIHVRSAHKKMVLLLGL